MRDRTLIVVPARGGSRRIAHKNLVPIAGIPLVAVSFGFSDRPADQLGAHAVIDHYRELLPALARLAPR